MKFLVVSVAALLILLGTVNRGSAWQVGDCLRTPTVMSMDQFRAGTKNGTEGWHVHIQCSFIPQIGSLDLRSASSNVTEDESTPGTFRSKTVFNINGTCMEQEVTLSSVNVTEAIFKIEEFSNTTRAYYFTSRPDKYIFEFICYVDIGPNSCCPIEALVINLYVNDEPPSALPYGNIVNDLNDQFKFDLGDEICYFRRREPPCPAALP